MKKYICFVLIMIFMSLSCYASDFSDVTDSYQWAADAINYLSENEIINGYPDGSFKPENNITKAETAKIISILFGNSIDKKEYNDVTEKSWYYSYVVNSGGYFLDEGNFYPDNKASRKEIAYAIYKAKSIKDATTKIKLEIDSNDKYYDAVCALYEKEILKGYPDGTLKLDEPVTRAEFAVMVKRAVDLKDTDVPALEQKPRNYFFIVTETAVAALDNGVVMEKVCGFNDGAYEEIYYDSETDIQSIDGNVRKVKTNDIIYFYRDYFGNVKGVLIVDNIENMLNNPVSVVHDIGSKRQYIGSYVLKVLKQSKLEFDNSELYGVSDDTHFYIYKNAEIKKGDIFDIDETNGEERGDYVFSYVIDGIIENIIIIKE